MLSGNEAIDLIRERILDYRAYRDWHGERQCYYMISDILNSDHFLSEKVWRLRFPPVYN